MTPDAAFELGCLVAVTGLLVHRAIERRRLIRFVHGLELPAGNERALSLALAGRLHVRHLPLPKRDPPFLSSLLGVIGSTPCAVIARGGCCSGVARLYILCLAELGIRAHQITLYNPVDLATHCLVEVILPDGPLIADPGYGIYYSDESGHPVGLMRLQQGVRPVFHSLPGSTFTNYPAGPYYNYDFALTRTANWTKTWTRRAAYRVLRRVTDGGVNRLRVPAWLEWPQVLVALILSGLYLSFLVLKAIVG